MRCPKCKQDFDTRFCPNCGYSPETDMGIQPPHAPEPPPIDGSQTSYQQPYAGYQPPPVIIHNNISTPNNRAISPKRKWIAFFLCLILGLFGAHRFYVGKIGTGTLMLIIVGFFPPIPAFFFIIDLIMILFGSFTDKQGNFLV